MTKEAQYFRNAAARLDKPIAAYSIRPTMRPTVRRERILASREAKAQKYKTLQRALYGLACAWDDDAIPVALSLVVTKTAVELLLKYDRYPYPVIRMHELKALLEISAYQRAAAERIQVERLYSQSRKNDGAVTVLRDLTDIAAVVSVMHSATEPHRVIPHLREMEFNPYRIAVDAGLLNQEQWSEARVALQELIDSQPTDRPDPGEEIRREVREIVARRAVEDFAPTPAWLAERLIELADVRKGHRVLEPSAGSGALVDLLVPLVGKDSIRLCETSEQLCMILYRKGYTPIVRDFMRYAECDLSPVDRVVMNPPFSKGDWMAHVMIAYDALENGGRLAAIVPAAIKAIMGEAAINRSAFARWLDRQHYQIETVPGQPFASVGYNVSVCMLAIDRIG
jgi:hypothetical protein